MLAIELYGKAITLDGANHVYFSKRSAAYLKHGDANAALDDAIACIGLNPDFKKGYFRKGAALHSLKRYDDAIAAYDEGLQKFPGDATLTKQMEEVKLEQRREEEKAATAARLKQERETEEQRQQQELRRREKDEAERRRREQSVLEKRRKTQEEDRLRLQQQQELEQREQQRMQQRREEERAAARGATRAGTGDGRAAASARTGGNKRVLRHKQCCPILMPHLPAYPLSMSISFHSMTHTVSAWGPLEKCFCAVMPYLMFNLPSNE